MKYQAFALILLLSCTNTNEGDIKKISDAPLKNIDSPFIKKELPDLLPLVRTNDSVSIMYNENEMTLSFSYVNEYGEKKVTLIGKYHNTFGQPPHEVKILKSLTDSNNVFALVATNDVQLGISSDQIYIFKLEKNTAEVSTVCHFDRIAVYAGTSGIDTLSNITQYDYRIIPINKGKKQKLILYEYIPYKFEDEMKNEKHRYKIKTRMCLFN